MQRTKHGKNGASPLILVFDRHEPPPPMAQRTGSCYGLPATDYGPRIAGHGDRLRRPATDTSYGDRLRILGNGPGSREQTRRAATHGFTATELARCCRTTRCSGRARLKLKARR